MVPLRAAPNDCRAFLGRLLGVSTPRLVQIPAHAAFDRALGEVAKWLGSGLQNRHTPVRIRSSPQAECGPRRAIATLSERPARPPPSHRRFPRPMTRARPLGGMADAGDLKSLARKGVPVRVRQGLRVKVWRRAARCLRDSRAGPFLQVSCRSQLPESSGIAASGAAAPGRSVRCRSVRCRRSGAADHSGGSCWRAMAGVAHRACLQTLAVGNAATMPHEPVGPIVFRTTRSPEHTR
jgi:hypothetical protein